jgi:DNA primase catalytic subunit
VRSSQENSAELNQELVFDVIRKTYEKAKNNEEMTIQKLMEDLIIDLKTCSE